MSDTLRIVDQTFSHKAAIAAVNAEIRPAHTTVPHAHTHVRPQRRFFHILETDMSCPKHCKSFHVFHHSFLMSALDAGGKLPLNDFPLEEKEEDNLR